MNRLKPTLGVSPLKNAVGPSSLNRSFTTTIPDTLRSKLAFWIRVLTVSRGAATVIDATAPAIEAIKFWVQVALWKSVTPRAYSFVTADAPKSWREAVQWPEWRRPATKVATLNQKKNLLRSFQVHSVPLSTPILDTTLSLPPWKSEQNLDHGKLLDLLDAWFWVRLVVIIPKRDTMRLHGWTNCINTYDFANPGQATVTEDDISGKKARIKVKVLPASWSLHHHLAFPFSKCVRELRPVMSLD